MFRGKELPSQTLIARLGLVFFQQENLFKASGPNQQGRDSLLIGSSMLIRKLQSTTDKSNDRYPGKVVTQNDQNRTF